MNAKQIEATLKDVYGVEMSYMFKSQNHPKNTPIHRLTLAFDVQLMRNGVAFMTVDYAMGIGHSPSYKALSRKYVNQNCIALFDAMHTECLTGRPAKSGAQRAAPKLANVMHCVLSDGRAIDSGGFSEWCNEFGYSDDSIKAKACYDACLQCGLKLRAAFGEAVLNELYELFQDY